MDELVAYIIALFVRDSVLQALFTAVNAPQIQYLLSSGNYVSSVACFRPSQRIAAMYPKILVWTTGRTQNPTGDQRPTRFEGLIKIEVATRVSESVDPNATDTLNQIKFRIQQLMLSDPFVTPNVPGIRSQQISNSYQCSKCLEISPTGYLPTTDPTFERYMSTYAVMITHNNPGSATPVYIEAIYDPTGMP